MSADVTSAAVFSRHSTLAQIQGRTNFLFDSYYGSGGYEDGTYLDWHPREVLTDDKGNILEQLPKFKSRRARSYYYNVIKTVVDVPISYIFQAPIMRDGHEFWTDFVADCTGRGTPLNTMMEELARYARLFGVMFFIIDKPSAITPPQTKGEEIRQDLRPRLIPIFPSDVVDYHIQDGVLKWAKILEKYETSEDPLEGKTVGYRVRIWTETEWFLYDVSTTNEMSDDPYSTIPKVKLSNPAPLSKRQAAQDKTTLHSQGTHSLGKVPLIGVYNQQPEFGEIFGTTDIFQSTRINRRIYNLCSELDEILRDQTFSILTIPTDNTEEPSTKVSGTTNGLYYTPTSGGARPEYISPDGTCAETIAKNIRELRTEIYRAASMQYAEGIENVRSGVSKQWNFDQTNRFLSGLAKRCEEAEKDASWFVLKWMSIDPDSQIPAGDGKKKAAAEVQYPGTFNVSDLMEEIEQTDAIIAMRISKKFAQRVAEDLVRKKYPNMTKIERDEIYKEISESDMINPPLAAMMGPQSSLAAGASLQARVRSMRGMKMNMPTMSTGSATRVPTPDQPALDQSA